MAKRESDLIYYNVKVVDSNQEPIEHAKVTFIVNGNQKDGDIGTEYTNKNGFASFRYTPKDERQEPNEDPADVEFEECICGVEADGFEIIKADENEGIGVSPSYEEANNDGDEYTLIELIPETTRNYCNILVLEKVTNTPMQGVVVNMSGVADIYGYTSKTTDTNGKCTFVYKNSGIYYAEIILNGYEVDYEASKPYVGNKISVDTTIDKTDVRRVYVKQAKDTNYYYIVGVKDNGEKGVEGAKVRLYEDLSFSKPYSFENVNKNQKQEEYLDEVFFIICEILSPIVDIDVFKLSITDRFVQDLGVSLKEIKGVFDSKFNIHLAEEDELVLGDMETINDLVNYVKDNSSISTLPKTIYTSQSNGLINPINIGKKASKPNSIYARGIYLPIEEGYEISKYSWTINYGKVVPTTSETTPGLTLKVYSYAGGLCYHNFMILDAQTYKPLPDVEVVYTDENENILAKKKSDEDGIVEYNNKIERVYISIELKGYKNYDRTSYPGSYSSDSFSAIYLNQERTIQVVDYDGDPVEKIKVTVFTYDDLGNKLYFGSYFTYETGYIDPLPYEIYERAYTSKIYVGVLMRKYIEYQNSLIKQIAGTITMSIVFRLPNSFDDSEEVENEFERFNDVSANGIKKLISNGNDELDDVEVGYTDKVTYNTDDFRINIIDPDSVNTYDILTCSPIIINKNNKSVIGSVTIDMKKDLNDIHLKTINRYSGYYNPIFKDILFYNNCVLEDDNMIECPYSNTAFDYDYEDGYGKFGIIDHMWFHKVNDDKDTKIIKSANPYYPLTGQYALDNRKYNVFETNWDVSHYTRQTSIDKTERCFNTVSMKEGICMFGSKYLNVPNTIEICGVSLGEDYDGTWNDDWIANPDGCPGEVMFKEVNDNSVDFYFFFRKRILRHFRENLKEEFKKYIGEDQSFGKPGVDDDIDEYVEKNVLKLYKLEKVRIFIRRTKKGQHNSKIENEYGKYLQYVPDSKTGELVELTKDNLGYFKSHGFVEINNVTMTKLARDDFDRKLVYNLRNGTKEDFGFSLVLKKI